MHKKALKIARKSGWPKEAGSELPETGSMNLVEFYLRARNEALKDAAEAIKKSSNALSAVNGMVLSDSLLVSLSNA